jgi:hypothetical protein
MVGKALAIIGLTIGLSSCAVGSALPDGVGPGAEYPGARNILLAQGYKPAPPADDRADSCERRQSNFCEPYPEAADCAGTGLGQCLMYWSREGMTLTIVTVGDDPKIIRSVDRS